jgi:catechol 2,3-dioxygenase-like lactoylglutathione lyase family enzyme
MSTADSKTTPLPAPKGMKPKGIHHIAFASQNTAATYDFYHNKLGMNLVRTENHRQEGGYFRHFFFDMGNEQMMGFFEVNGVGEKPDFKTDLSKSLGLPLWVNHIAFNAESVERYDELKQRAKENGVEFLAQVDHDWLKSMYFMDPNGLMLEYTYEVPGKLEEDPQDLETAYNLLFQDPDTIGEESSKEDKVDVDV